MNSNIFTNNIIAFNSLVISNIFSVSISFIGLIISIIFSALSVIRNNKSAKKNHEMQIEIQEQNNHWEEYKRQQDKIIERLTKEQNGILDKHLMDLVSKFDAFFQSNVHFTQMNQDTNLALDEIYAKMKEQEEKSQKIDQQLNNTLEKIAEKVHKQDQQIDDILNNSVELLKMKEDEHF